MSVYESLYTTKRSQLGNGICVVIRMNDDLCLCYDGVQRRERLLGAHYHGLKKLAHLPVRAFMLRSDGSHDTACPELDTGVPESLQGEDAETMHSLMRLTRDFWRATEAAMEWRHVLEFSEAAYPHIQHLIRQAATLEVRALDGAVKGFEKFVRPRDWSSGYFCVVSGKEPRYKELSKQYFQRFLRKKNGARGGAGHQLVYLEGEYTMDSVFDALAKRYVNQRLGEVFAGSLAGLEQDILGDAAAIALDELF